MAKGKFGFWNALAGFIIRRRIWILLAVVAATVFLAFQWKNMRFSYTEANLLPDDNQYNVEYQNFLNKFGEEGNVIVIGTKDSTLFSPDKLEAWIDLEERLKAYPEVEFTIGLGSLRELKKSKTDKKFELSLLFSDTTDFSKTKVDQYQKKLFDSLPFYEGLIYNPEKTTVQTAVYLKKSIVNSKERKTFVLDEFQPMMEKFEKREDLEVHVSGMPYVRTLNSKNIVDEIQWFVGGALFVTGLIFFLFFKSFRATLISMLTVVIGVMWAFGFLGLLHYEITVLTAIIPPLIIVIGVPNCIFLINKYQQEIKNHGNQAKSLYRVISKVGNATLMTNVTTASGFATFIITQSKLLSEFGIVASVNILAIFLLSLLIIPTIYSFMKPPSDKHLRHLGKNWVDKKVAWLQYVVRYKRVTVYFVAVGLLVISLIGIYMIRVSGSMLEDMPQESGFFKDIEFFEQEFDGIMPLEFMVDTKQKKGVMKLSTLKKMQELEEEINDVPEFSKPLSVVDVVKYSKQAFYNGKPKYYQVPTSQERNFIFPYFKDMSGQNDMLNSYVDSTGRYARLTTYMKDVGTDEMERIEANLDPKIKEIFPSEDYEVTMTGKALLFQKGTTYLVHNLILSLSLAIALIAIFMAWMFRSFKMIIISLIPNLLPLLITAGMMGIIGVPIKPSTILVFSIAFGISVDDTIHFLAKYRQELKLHNWNFKHAVYPALKETSVSMFYTSIVLFFGFSVFLISSFGGTKALGGLVSVTLLFAMLSNLLLLPSLLLSLAKNVANKKTLRKPEFDVIDEGEEKEEE